MYLQEDFETNCLIMYENGQNIDVIYAEVVTVRGYLMEA